jgi:hypothetical protein
LSAAAKATRKGGVTLDGVEVDAPATNAATADLSVALTAIGVGSVEAFLRGKGRDNNDASDRNATVTIWAPSEIVVPRKVAEGG